MKKSIKKQGHCVIDYKEFLLKLKSLFEIMGSKEIPAKEFHKCIKEKHFPYTSKIASVLKRKGFIDISGFGKKDRKFYATNKVSLLTEVDAKYILEYIRSYKRASVKKDKQREKPVQKPVNEQKKDAPTSGEKIYFVGEAIALLKSKGYKILKPVTAYEEV